RDPKAGSIFRRGLDRFDNLRVGMSQYGWSPGADVIDILISVHVPHMSAFGLVDEERLAAYRPERPHRRVHAARDVLQRLREKLFGFGARNHSSRLAATAPKARGKYNIQITAALTPAKKCFHQRTALASHDHPGVHVMPLEPALGRFQNKADVVRGGN